MDREHRDKRFVYSLRIIKGEEETLVQDGKRPAPFDMTPATADSDAVAGESPSAEPGFFSLLKQMEGSKSDRIRRSAATVRRMLEDGITRFSRADWAAITGMDKKDVGDACDYLVSHKLVANVSKHHNHSEYVFTLPGIEQAQEETEPKV